MERLHRFANALETICRVLSVMTDETFQLHLEGYEELHHTPRCYRNRPQKVVHAILILLFALPAVAQYDTTKLAQIDPYYINAFNHAECKNQIDTAYQIASLPTIIRSGAVGEVYEFEEFIPFKIFWNPHGTLKYYHVQSGKCRGFSFSLPCHTPGFYHIIFEHPEKPCLMNIRVDSLTATGHKVWMGMFQRCNPDVILGRYRPQAQALNFPTGTPTKIEVWKKDGVEEWSQIPPPDDGFVLIKTVETTNAGAFNYMLPGFGLYKFRYESPGNPWKCYEFLLFTFNKYQINWGTATR